jgi:O-antigen/teichoic acid export membrane protein
MAHAVGVMTPEIYKQAGKQDLPALRRLSVEGARNTMFFAVPLLVGLIALGRPFIRLWMGPGYEASATILIILAIPQFGLLASRGCGAVLWGLGCVQLLAVITIAEAVINVALSVFFSVGMGMGIYGIALGTAIPMVITGWILIPFYACRKMEFGMLKYLRLTGARWLPATAVLFGAAWTLKIFIDLSTWGHFALAVILICLVYLPIGWFFMLRPSTHEVPPYMIVPSGESLT